MGFNTTVLIRNSDLPDIEQDETFGSVLSTAIRAADTAEYMLEKSGRTRTGVIGFSELAECNRDTGTSYQIEVSMPVHADAEMVHDVHDGHLTVFRPMMAGASYEACERLAGLLARHGYAISDKSTGQAWKPVKGEDITYRDWMNGSDTDTLVSSGQTSILVLNDGISDIAGDPKFGARLVSAIRDYVGVEKRLHEMHGEGQDLFRFSRLDSVGAGSHANCVQIIGVTPENGYDALVAGRNWGLMLRPYTDILELTSDESTRRRRTDLKRERLAEAADVLLYSGFHVRAPDAARAKAPAGWNASRWPKRPEADAPGPEL
jgi:hypothetical protein